MKFKINDRNWEIKETDQEHMKAIMNNKNSDGYYYGITKYTEQIIYLCDELCEEQKKQTLLHELMHCYLGVYCSWQTDSMDVELVCDVSANSHYIIHEIVEDYFKYYKKSFIDLIMEK